MADQSPNENRFPVNVTPIRSRATRLLQGYLNLTKAVSALPQTVHANVRLSWSAEAVGSIRASVVGPPHFVHGGR
jgi:hypothetical protein